jgi:hypothetical protein
MDDITIEPVRDGDLAEILRTFERFWGDREFPRNLHHPLFFCEFGDTAFVGRQAVVADYAGSGRTRVVMRRPLAPGGL